MYFKIMCFHITLENKPIHFTVDCGSTNVFSSNRTRIINGNELTDWQVLGSNLLSGMKMAIILHTNILTFVTPK